MAKKSDLGLAKGSIFDIISSVDKSAEVLSQSKSAVISDYIDSGNYILNAAMTGSIFRGLPTGGRTLLLGGAPGSGKSYLALSFCRNAQLKGYTPIYMDSEGAIDIEFVSRLGCDPNNFIIKQVTTIREVSTFMANVLKAINEKPEQERDKVIFVLDSIGNLTSDKEMTTTLEGGGTRDMTKQQEIKALYRTNATALARANSAFIVCSHVYQTMDLYGGNKISGGCLVPTSKIKTPNGDVEIQNIKVGDSVIDCYGNASSVLKTFRFNKPTIKFVFSDGYEIECSEDHRFMIEMEDGTVGWKKAKDLETGDFILQLFEE